MHLIDPDDSCPCDSGIRWSECCARYLPLTLRYVPVRLLGPDDSVRSGCNRGGHCCRNVHVPLTPFDVLRLSRCLQTSTGELLSEWVVISPEGGVEIDGDPQCPFLQDNQCTVYSLRPDSCRMYPFWSVPLPEGEMLVERHTCSGCWQECRPEQRTVATVLEEAGVAEGRRAEKLYQDTLTELEARGVTEEEIEEFMARVYDSDSASLPKAEDGDGEGDDLEGRFGRIVRELAAEYRL